MLRGNKYDEKVDVFSFGIIMCEIIGRVQADPDFMPRTDDFGLNQQQFIEKFCKGDKCDDPCPEIFYQIAFHCCDLNPDRRPSFKILAEWFDRLAIHGAILGNHHHPPTDLKWDIRQFRGDSSTCNTPEICESPPEFPIASPKSVESKTPSPEKEKVPEILSRNSPHLAKDFAPNGDRIRDSWRARRKAKLRESGQRVKKPTLNNNNNVSPTEVHKKPPSIAASASKT